MRIADRLRRLEATAAAHAGDPGCVVQIVRADDDLPKPTADWIEVTLRFDQPGREWPDDDDAEG